MWRHSRVLKAVRCSGKVTSSAQVWGSPLKPGGPWTVVRFFCVPGEVVIAFPRTFEYGAPERNVPRLSERKLANASWGASVMMVRMLRP
jgi:hypothetical protein